MKDRLIRLLRNLAEATRSFQIIGFSWSWADGFNELYLLEVGWLGIKLIVWNGVPKLGVEWTLGWRVWLGPYLWRP